MPDALEKTVFRSSIEFPVQTSGILTTCTAANRFTTLQGDPCNEESAWNLHSLQWRLLLALQCHGSSFLCGH